MGDPPVVHHSAMAAAHATPLPFPLLPQYPSSPPVDDELGAVKDESEGYGAPTSSPAPTHPSSSSTPAPRHMQSWKRAPPGFNCLNCRRRGKKCGGERPACAFCVEKDVPCYYQDKHSHLPEYKAAYNEYRRHNGRPVKETTLATLMDAEIDAEIAEMVGLDPASKKGRKGSNPSRRKHRKKTATTTETAPDAESSTTTTTAPDTEPMATSTPAPDTKPATTSIPAPNSPESEEGSSAPTKAPEDLCPTSSVPSKRPATSPLPHRRRVSAPATQTNHKDESTNSVEASDTTENITAPSHSQRRAAFTYLAPPPPPTYVLPPPPPPPSPTEMSELDLGPSVLRSSPKTDPALPPSEPPTDPNVGAADLALIPVGVLFPQILSMTPATMPSVKLFQRRGGAGKAEGLAAMAHKFQPELVPRRMPSMGTPTSAPKDNTLGLSLYPSPQTNPPRRDEPQPGDTVGPPSEMLRRFPVPPLFSGPSLIRPIAQSLPPGIIGPIAYPSFLPNASWHLAPRHIPKNSPPAPPRAPTEHLAAPSSSPFAFSMTTPHLPHIPQGNALHLTDHHVIGDPQAPTPTSDPNEPHGISWHFTSALRTSAPRH